MKQEQGEKRQALLQAALELFTEYGFHGTPTAKIAQQAGVAAGTLFHYFKTKEELINQLYLEIKEEFREILAEGVVPELPLRSKIRRIWENTLRWFLENPTKILFFRQFSASPYITALTKEQGMQHLRFVVELIEEGKHQEIVKEMPFDLLFAIASGLLETTGMYFLTYPEQFEDEQYREKAFAAYWDCLKR